MINKLRALLLVVLMGLSGWAGWKLHPTCSTQSVSNNKQEDTVVIRKPDGTIEKRTSIRESNEVRRTPEKMLPKWSTQAETRAPLSKLSDYSYTVNLYRRVSDTNLWVGAGLSNKKEVSLGVRLDF